MDRTGTLDSPEFPIAGGDQGSCICVCVPYMHICYVHMCVQLPASVLACAEV